MIVSIGCIVAVALMLYLPGLPFYWQGTLIFCTRPAITPVTTGSFFYAWRIITGPCLLVSLLLCQIRIFGIAVSFQLTQRHTQRRVTNVPARQGVGSTVLRGNQIVTRVAWASLRASTVVLLSSVVLNINLFVDSETFAGNVILLRISYLLPAIQHMYSPLIYLFFFPEFRRNAFFRCDRQP